MNSVIYINGAYLIILISNGSAIFIVNLKTVFFFFYKFDVCDILINTNSA